MTTSPCYLNEEYVEIGRRLYLQHQNKSREALSSFISKNGRIDGTKLKEKWFTAINADIFLSHSHRDEEQVIAFAGWLYDTFGLTSFIDSCVWGYCDDLLKEIDDKYCRNLFGPTYNYNLRNCSTSHVHVMLSSALSEMIDKTECVIFFNTPQSIALEEEIDSVRNDETRTYSQWIYYELSMAQMIRQTDPERFRGSINENYRYFYLIHDSIKDIPFEYDVSKLFSGMNELTDEILYRWKKHYDLSEDDEFALDELYKLCAKK